MVLTQQWSIMVTNPTLSIIVTNQTIAHYGY